MTFDMINKNSYYSLDLSHNLIQVNHIFAEYNNLNPVYENDNSSMGNNS